MNLTTSNWVQRNPLILPKYASIQQTIHRQPLKIENIPAEEIHSLQRNRSHKAINNQWF